jgi:ferric-dicitrate binding protein FerR (iron transport regulator)
MSELNDILSTGGNGKGKLPEEKLMAYLEGKLSPEEQHEVEEWLSAEGMESDALEGLQSLETEDTKKSVAKINYELRKELGSRNKRRTKHIKDNKWSWLAILIVLMLAIVCYIAIRVASNQ